MKDGEGLAVLADGIQAAFAAGAVAALARRGHTWRVVAGAGLGAQVGVLAALGEAEEAARRWARQGELGCPLLAPLLEEAAARLEGLPGVAAAIDPWRAPGWLDPRSLAEHLAPEGAGLPGRLQRRGVQVLVLLQEVQEGQLRWVNLGAGGAELAGEALTAAAAFPAGWGPQGQGRRWGGVGVLAGAVEDLWGRAEAWTVVCGFPVPPAARPWVGDSLWEQVQRREEVLAAAAVARWARHGAVRAVVAPTQALWRRAEGREEAELGVEYPLPWERNGELAGRLVAAGLAAAEGQPG